jgi:tetratricopeptide (TPR) repeat protein
MKAKAVAVLMLSIAAAAAQMESPKESPKESASPSAGGGQTLFPNQQAFLNLPEENRMEFTKHMTEANRLFQQKRVFETLEEISQALRIFDDSPEIYNLRGSCYVEFRDFKRALKDFEKAREYSKDNPNLDFNIAEVYFVTNQWQKAETLYESILKLIPADDRNMMSLQRLVEFKLMLCKMRLGKKDEATILAEKYDFLDDSPYYYYAHAALAYEAKDLIKAEEWLAMAGRVFRDPNTVAPWQDTLVEYGYIKSFYGDDSSAEN